MRFHLVNVLVKFQLLIFSQLGSEPNKRNSSYNMSFRMNKKVNKSLLLGTQKKLLNGFKSRWRHISTLPSTFCRDEHLLFLPKKSIEMSETDWSPMIDVPLLPLTTSYLPENFSKDTYRQMNPSGFDTFQLKKKSMLEMTIQRLTQNFQIVSPNGGISVTIDPKYTMNMSLWEYYYQSNNMKSNLYVLTSSAIIGDENLQLKYLFYDCLVDSFKPRYINHSLLTFKTLQNFNDDYQNDFYGRDILSVIFPTQRYVILYTKKDLKMQEAAW